MRISIIIPALNEEDCIADLLARLPADCEVIVVDGRSTDGTVQRARQGGARVLVAPARGRGQQLRAGVAAATGDVFWFLHADASPGPECTSMIRGALAAGADSGVFRPRFAASPFLTWIYPRLRWFGLTYGDAGLFTRRSSYEAVGGFRPVALFEDVELIGRLRRHGRLMDLPFPLEASSRRFQGRLWRTWLRWISLQALYLLGVSPDRLARWYGRSAGLPPAVGRARASEMDSEDP